MALHYHPRRRTSTPPHRHARSRSLACMLLAHRTGRPSATPCLAELTRLRERNALFAVLRGGLYMDGERTPGHTWDGWRGREREGSLINHSTEGDFAGTSLRAWRKRIFDREGWRTPITLLAIDMYLLCRRER